MPGPAPQGDFRTLLSCRLAPYLCWPQDAFAAQHLQSRNALTSLRMRMGQSDIESLLKETRVFAPSPEFSARSRCKSLDEYRTLYDQSVNDPETFWANVAKELHWFEPWTKVLEWKEPHAKWFVGGKTNLSYNCLDRHLDGPTANKTAYIWEGEPGDTRTLTYRELHREVCKFANVLKARGIRKGDRVCIYMPMVLELPIAMLACARIGAAHSIVFGGFSANHRCGTFNRFWWV